MMHQVMSGRIRMKKVGIVSCYFQHNYGSMLQALATQMALEKLGYQNETINISGFDAEIKKAKLLYFAKASLTSGILLSKLGMAMTVLRRKLLKGEYSKNTIVRNRKFDCFYRNFFHLSDAYSSKSELGKKCQEFYSAILVGSDQLWLPGNIAGDYYTLNFVPQSVNTVAYATSFGQAKLPGDMEKKASKFLKKIRHISVREDSGKKLIQELTGRNVPVVCDPTLLFTGEEWLAIQQETPKINEPYILCYFLGNNPRYREFAKRLREKTGFKIAALVHLDEYIKSDEDYADDTPYDIDPADFLNLVRHARYICTDSFHGSVFSILYQKTFFAFRRYARENQYSTNGRMDTLFHLAGIENRILNGTEDVQQCLNMKIDYDIVLGNIERIRKESYQYLAAALEDRKSTDL